MESCAIMRHKHAMITQTLFSVKKLKYERENLSMKGHDGRTKRDRTSLESQFTCTK